MTSEVAIVTIEVAQPALILPPLSHSVDEATEAVFTVLAVGTEPLVYQWFFRGQELTGETEPRLRLPSVQISQAGNYTVEVSNSAGSVTSPAACENSGVQAGVVVVATRIEPGCIWLKSSIE